MLYLENSCVFFLDPREHPCSTPLHIIVWKSLNHDHKMLRNQGKHFKRKKNLKNINLMI